MIHRFKAYVQAEGLFKEGDRILVALSGGMDSVFMARLFSQAGCLFALAHCNFQLRGTESDEDARFNKALAEELGVDYYQTTFNTKKEAQNKKLSIQVAARNLRYQWLRELKEQHRFTAIAIGHHQDDVLETILINLLRGTGLAGLHGIFPKRGDLIRPLLFLNRQEIEEVMKAGRFPYREDRSNAEDKYVRNKLRLNVIPLLKELKPDLTSRFMLTASNVRSAEDLLEVFIEEKKEAICLSDHNELRVSLERLMKERMPNELLYAWLSPLGFSKKSAESALQGSLKLSGRQFFSSSHRMIRDREHLLIYPLQQPDELPSVEEYFDTKLESAAGFAIPTSKNIACLDYERLTFPLKVRRWEAGDRFTPLGMKGEKKLSDFMIDLKLNLKEKGDLLVLLSGEDIVWVIGHRISEHFKIKPATTKIYTLARRKKTDQTL